METTARIRIRSSLPGRERWEAKCLHRRPRLALRVEEILNAHPAVREVKANPLTGRVLVLFAPEHLVEGTENILRDALLETGVRDGIRIARKRHPLLQLARINRRSLMQAVTRSIVAVCFKVLYATAFGLMISAGALGGDIVMILGMAGAAVLLFALHVFADYRQNRSWREIACATEQELRLRVFSHVLEMDMVFFDNQSTGRLMTLIAEDTSNIKRFFEFGAGGIVQRVSSAVLAGSALLIISPVSALLTFLPILAFLLTAKYFQELLGRAYEHSRRHAGGFNHLLSGILGGISTVKSYTAERFEESRIRASNRETRRSAMDAGEKTSVYAGSLLLSLTTFVILSAAHNGIQVARGKQSSGLFSISLLMVRELLESIRGFNELTELYQNAIVAAARLNNLLKQKPDIMSGERRMPVHEVRGRIEFRNVTFHYHPSLKILDGMELRLPEETTTAVVGATGAGKSTLVRLLMRFYDVVQGEILLDGVDIRKLDLSDLRAAIGYVSQDLYLFHGTVAENIRYGSQDASDAELENAARTAEAHEFISRLPGGYDTLVGERGQKLSTGQRQRISIARAVLKKPRILVFDEATSAVDNETEAAIQRSIERISRGRSTILIAHRLSTVRRAHRIHVLHEGRVHESGNHEELMRLNNVYASLWRLQTGVDT